MVTVEAARKIGINACIDKIGRDFVQTYKNSSVYAYGDGETENSVFCYVGVSDAPPPSQPEGVLVLDSASEYPYRASCNVSLTDGTPRFIECVVPS